MRKISIQQDAVVHDLRKRYVLALSIIILLILASQIIIQYAIKDQEADSRIINIAGRQRMLSQRLSKAALMVYEADDVTIQHTYLEEEKKSLDLWRKSHQALQFGDAPMGLPGKNSEMVTNMFVKIEPNFQVVVQSAEAILALQEAGINDKEAMHPHIIRLMDNQLPFVKGMDEIVFQYDAEAQAKINRIKQIELILLVVTLLTIILEVVYIFRPAERKMNLTLKELNISRENLQEKNNKIMDSLEYAKVLQQAILPTEEKLQSALLEYFAIWKPCDVVGGDFYWVKETKLGTLIAVVDCTGHGVPGAFMTMAVNSILNHISEEICADNPATILKVLNAIVRQTMQKESNTLISDDGLEAGICYIPKSGDNLIFAGAKLAIFNATSQDVMIFKGDHYGIGYKNTPIDAEFTNHLLTITPESVFYITTDGFIDQCGGLKRHAFGKTRFTQLIAANVIKALSKQRQTFNEAMDTYMGEEDQRDDITVFAFRPRNIQV